MDTLARTGGRRDPVFETVTGKRFRGIIYPATDNGLPTLTFNAPRHLLRTRPDEPISAGEVFLDRVGRRFLIAANDCRPHAKTFSLIEITDHATWTRKATTVHPVTHQPMNGAAVSLGLIWVAIEDYNGRNADAGMNVSIDRKRILTGAAIQLGDMVDAYRVKRVSVSLGIHVGEVE